MVRTLDTALLSRTLPRTALSRLRPQGLRPLRVAPGASNAPGVLRTARPRAMARF